MAQKTENEETEFKVPETLSRCINNCGVTGNPATDNMCQTCFNATTNAAASLTSAKLSGPILKKPLRSAPFRSLERSGSSSETTADRSGGNEPMKKVNRCSGCGRKVGLTGFRCRCGDLFCSEHRYSDRHDCSYDYKAAGRQAIARENPVVKAAKIVRV